MSNMSKSSDAMIWVVSQPLEIKKEANRPDPVHATFPIHQTQNPLWQTKKPLQHQNRANYVVQCTTAAYGAVKQGDPHLHANVVVQSSGGRSYFSLPCLCLQLASHCAAVVVQHALPGAGRLVGALLLPATGEQGTHLESNSHGLELAVNQALHPM